jgi:hypothetical protein
MNFNLTPLQILGIVLAVNAALAGATTQLTNVFGPTMATWIVSVSSLVNTVLGSIIASISGQASQVRNVAAMPGVEKITVNDKANQTLAQVAADPVAAKVEATPEAKQAVERIARG